MKKSLLSLIIVFSVIFGATLPGIAEASEAFAAVHLEVEFAQGDNLVHIEATPEAHKKRAVGYITLDNVDENECEIVVRRVGVHGYIIQTVYAGNEEDCELEAQGENLVQIEAND